jgi:hypothetical protein
MNVAVTDRVEIGNGKNAVNYATRRFNASSSPG